MNNEKEGLKIELESYQKEIVMNVKNEIVTGKTALELHNQQIVLFSAHAIDRIIKRFKGSSISYYTSMINHVIKATDLSDLAEWKGFTSLSYTFINTAKQHSEAKIVITFIKESKAMKIITVMNEEENDTMDYRISEDDELTQKMNELRNRLKDSYNR